MSRYTRLEIDFPVIIDLFINFSLSYVKNASDHPTSKSYGDEDNLRKAVMDALVYCGHLKDDRYVVGGETFKSFGSDDLAVIKIFKIHKELTNHEIFPPMLNQSSR
jgi:Holliday junction resolvase RusA-like endonuclease